MPTDLDIYRSANILIKRYLEEAAFKAAMRADAMLKNGEIGGYLVWKRIVKAINEIQRDEPRDDEAVN